jgi:hypothetical protein
MQSAIYSRLALSTEVRRVAASIVEDAATFRTSMSPVENGRGQNTSSGTMSA